MGQGTDHYILVMIWILDYLCHILKSGRGDPVISTSASLSESSNHLISWVILVFTTDVNKKKKKFGSLQQGLHNVKVKGQPDVSTPTVKSTAIVQVSRVGGHNLKK